MKNYSVKKKDDNSHITVSVSDFSKGIDVVCGQNIMPISTAINCYNFDFKSGVLKQGIGFKLLTIPTSKTSDKVQAEINFETFTAEIKSLDIFRNYSCVYNEQRDKLVFYASDGYVWYVLLNNIFPVAVKLSVLDYTKKPIIFKTKIDGDDVIFVSNDTDNVGLWSGDETPQRFQSAPKVVDFCEYKNKLFFVVGGEQNQIFYTSNYDISDWDSSTLSTDEDFGSLLVNDGKGKINKLISYQGNLYVFRDYSILKITEYDGSPVATKTVFESGSKIYANSVQICGDEMIMLTHDGLIKFDGVSTQKIDLKISTLISTLDNQYAVSAYHCGKYYLALKLNYNDNMTIDCENFVSCRNNTLLCYDPFEKTYSLTRGVDILDMKSIQSECLNKLIFVYNSSYNSVFGELTTNGKNFDSNQKKYWCSPLSDLGYSNKQKIIKDVSLISKYDCTLTVFTEKEKKSFLVKGSELMNRFFVRLKGKQFGFKLTSTTDKAEISNIQFNVDLIEEGRAIW